MVEMVFIFIQALQLQKVPKSLKDIGVGFQLCVTDADAIATPMERRQHDFGVEWKFQLGRNNILFI